MLTKRAHLELATRLLCPLHGNGEPAQCKQQASLLQHAQHIGRRHLLQQYWGDVFGHLSKPSHCPCLCSDTSTRYEASRIINMKIDIVCERRFQSFIILVTQELNLNNHLACLGPEFLVLVAFTHNLEQEFFVTSLAEDL